MRTDPSIKRGFAVVELLIALTIVGIIASIAIPRFLNSTKSARAATCTGNRDAIRKACLIYMERNQAKAGDPLPSLDQLVAAGILAAVPRCPANGTYVWIDQEIPENGTPHIGCSIHYWPSLSPQEDIEEEETNPPFSSGFDNLRQPKRTKPGKKVLDRR